MIKSQYYWYFIQDGAGYHNIQSILRLHNIFSSLNTKSTPGIKILPILTRGKYLSVTPTIWHHLFGIYIHSVVSTEGWTQHFSPSLPPQATGMIYGLGERKIKTKYHWVKWNSKYFPTSDIWASRISFCWAEYLLSGLTDGGFEMFSDFADFQLLYWNNFL